MLFRIWFFPALLLHTESYSLNTLRISPENAKLERASIRAGWGTDGYCPPSPRNAELPRKFEEPCSRCCRESG